MMRRQRLWLVVQARLPGSGTEFSQNFCVIYIYIYIHTQGFLGVASVLPMSFIYYGFCLKLIGCYTGPDAQTLPELKCKNYSI